MAPPTTTQPQKTKSLLDKLSDVLIYIITFPFIIFFIAIRRALSGQKQPSHSYRDRLPEMHSIGGNQ